MKRGDFVRPIDRVKRADLGRGIIAEETVDGQGRPCFKVMWLSGLGEEWLESDLEIS